MEYGHPKNTDNVRLTDINNVHALTPYLFLFSSYIPFPLPTPPSRREIVTFLQIIQFGDFILVKKNQQRENLIFNVF